MTKTLFQYKQLDAVFPAWETFISSMKENNEDWRLALSQAVEKADEGCQKTKTMVPK